ncbi:MAG: dihydroneopterin aldolase family protein [Thermoplasmatales archaeon]|jgi:Uncharacterized protein conserved in archaea
MPDPASKFFSCSNVERAIFEAGIKLGAIYHQYTGIPVNQYNVEYLEKAIEMATEAQPFVEEVKVNIDRNKIGKELSVYKYKTLTGDMINVTIKINYEGARVIGEMKFIDEMNYPLMFFRVDKNDQ